jgi:capsular exopolysaccharide synthesis family protein
VILSKNQFVIKGKYKEMNFKYKSDHLPFILQTPAGPVSIHLREGQKIPDYDVNISLYNPLLVARYYANNVLSTEVSKQVDVINLKVVISNVQKGRDILNTLVFFYNQDAIEQVNRSANNTAQFIDNRLGLIESELSGVELDVEKYKKEHQLTDISADAEVFLQQNTQYERQRVEVETQLSLIRFVEDFINQKSNQNALIPNLGLKDVGLVTVINTYNELVMTRERVANSSANENPAIQKLNQQIESSRQAISNSIGLSRKGLEIQRDDIKTQNIVALSKISNLPRKEREFIEIKRQQQVKETLYLFLLQKREEASLTMAVTVPKGRMLNSPDSDKQVGPRSFVITVLFLLIGVFLPVLIIFIRDLINTSVISRSQIEKATDIPILSELGHNDSGEVIIDHGSNIDSNAELFRLLRTKLQFILDYPSQKVILVTSTEPGEGKSYVSINLAISLSLTGKKVIIIGLDLRKPQLKRHLNLLDEEGMSSFLSGQNHDYRSLIQKLSEYPNLSVIAAGVIPPNPNELILSEKLDLLIDELRKVYDYIVIDTAPVGAVSDTFLIDRVTDIALYIVRMEFSDKRNLEYLNHLKQDRTLKRPYIVLNDMNMQSKYYYHRGYSYGYGKYYGGIK